MCMHHEMEIREKKKKERKKNENKIVIAMS
jgi:hypothetical protein